MDTAVELADINDTDSVNRQGEHDVATSVDNTCYMKLASKLNLVIGLLDYKHSSLQFNIFLALLLVPPIFDTAKRSNTFVVYFWHLAQ